MEESISDEIKKECKDVFEVFDTDKDDKITIPEFEEAFKALGINLSKSELDDIIDEYSDGNNYKFNFNLFCKIYSDFINTHPPSEDDLNEAFKIFDSDNDGIIPHLEMRYFMKNFSDNLKDSEIDELLKEIDINNNGLINYKEFVKLIKEKGYR